MYTYIYIDTFFFSHYPPSCSITSDLDIDPCAIQQDLIAYPLQLQEFASINPRLSVHPTPSLSPLTNTSLFSESMSSFSVERVSCAILLESRYKGYHMVCVFLFLTYFT